jgi:uncharacterized membrane protein (UPF0127 family)
MLSHNATIIGKRKMQSQSNNKLSTLGVKIIEANGFFNRFSGFMLRNKPNYAMLFRNCSSVHTFFMLFNLDIVFLDRDGNILKIKADIKPWRIVLPVEKSVDILEIPSGLVDLEWFRNS